jgi:hypothetical protein
MNDTENRNSNIILVAAASAAISGGGAHLATKESDDLFLNTTTIEDCRSFSAHAREHEKTSCEIEKTNLMIRCSRK